MKKELKKAWILIFVITLIAWLLMGIALVLLWEVDWRVAVGVALFVTGYGIEQGVNRAKERFTKGREIVAVIETLKKKGSDNPNAN